MCLYLAKYIIVHLDDDKMATATVPVFLFLLTLLVSVSVSDAGDYCGGYLYNGYPQYCIYGCCGYRNQECCSGSIGLIVGLCVGGAVFLFFIILTICLCRRRYYNGVVYRNQPAVVVQQGTVTTQGGIVTTAGVQPGVVYPPYQQYPGAMGSAPQPPYYQTPYPPQPMPYGSAPPAYDTLNFNREGGVTNKGFQ